jgi:glycosyltransferase involved in cell wall biosynthesis
MIPFRSHMPIVNIITINRNNKAGLQRTIESVLMQKYRMINHIIIDGNSSDGSAEYLKELCSNLSCDD